MKEVIVLSTIASLVGVLGIIGIELYALTKGVDGVGLSISVGALSSIITILIRNMLKWKK
jgi:hypothetical protein